MGFLNKLLSKLRHEMWKKALSINSTGVNLTRKTVPNNYTYSLEENAI